MGFQPNDEIRVYNEMPTQYNLVGRNRTYVFAPARDGMPSMNYVAFSDVEYVNSTGNAFTAGFLVFDESERDSVYDALHIRDWQNNVWFDAKIEDTITRPTLDKVQRIVDETNLAVIERFRGKIVYYTNTGKDVSQKIVNIVNARYDELCTNNIRSKIKLQKNDIEQRIANDEVSDLKKQIEDLKALVASMASAVPVNGDAVKVSEMSFESDINATVANDEKPQKVSKPKKNHK